MKNSEIEVLSESVNCPVVHMPGRRFPGVLIQGDSLRILLSHVEELENSMKSPDKREVDSSIAHLKLILAGFVEEFERVMKLHGRELPYSKDV